MHHSSEDNSWNLLAQWCLARRGHQFLAATGLLLTSACLAVAASWALAPLFDEAIHTAHWPTLAAIALAQLLLLAGKEATGAFAAQLYSRHALGEAAERSEQLYEALRRRKLDFFQARGQGELIHLLRGDTTALEGMFSHNLGGAVVHGVQLAVVLAVMTAWQPALALLGLFGSGAMLACSLAAAHVSDRLLRREIDHHVEIGEHLLRTLGLHGRLLMTAAAPNWAQRHLQQLLGRYAAVALRRRVLPDWMGTAGFTLGHVAAFLLYLFGGMLVLGGRLSIGQFVAAAALLTCATAAAAQMGNSMVAIRDGLVRLHRIHQELPRAADLSADAHQGAAGTIRGHYRLHDVTVTYPGGRHGLCRVTAEIRPGAITAVVGPSGAGKTTLAGALLRLLEPQEGEIVLDGCPVANFSHAALSQQVAYVPQQPVLFRGTIRENLLLGRAADEDQLLAACREAHIDQRVLRDSAGLDADVGESGSTFSAGERQRLAIARALVADPQVLILDEPTAHLDPGARRLVHQTLSRRARRGATVVLLCHELPGDLPVDAVIRLEDGRCVPPDAKRDTSSRTSAAWVDPDSNALALTAAQIHP